MQYAIICSYNSTFSNNLIKSNFFQKSYRLAIRTEGMIESLIKNLKSDNVELQMHCASAIFKVSTEHFKIINFFSQKIHDLFTKIFKFQLSSTLS